MAYKKIDNYFSFADIAIQNNVDKNRSLIFLNKVNASIDWKPVQKMFIEFYETGKSKEGERTYSPLLFKCMLLQKWFQIKSDPELASRSMTKFPLSLFLICLWIILLLNIVLFHALESAFLKIP